MSLSTFFWFLLVITTAVVCVSCELPCKVRAFDQEPTNAASTHCNAYVTTQDFDTTKDCWTIRVPQGNSHRKKGSDPGRNRENQADHVYQECETLIWLRNNRRSSNVFAAGFCVYLCIDYALIIRGRTASHGFRRSSHATSCPISSAIANRTRRRSSNTEDTTLLRTGRKDEMR